MRRAVHLLVPELLFGHGRPRNSRFACGSRTGRETGVSRTAFPNGVRERGKLLLCILCGVAAIYLLFFHRLADRDLWSSHEARAGMDAQTVLDDGAWGLPRLFSGEPELQKPP